MYLPTMAMLTRAWVVHTLQQVGHSSNRRHGTAAELTHHIGVEALLEQDLRHIVDARRIHAVDHAFGIDIETFLNKYSINLFLLLFPFYFFFPSYFHTLYIYLLNLYFPSPHTSFSPILPSNTFLHSFPTFLPSFISSYLSYPSNYHHHYNPHFSPLSNQPNYHIFHPSSILLNFLHQFLKSLIPYYLFKFILNSSLPPPPNIFLTSH